MIPLGVRPVQSDQGQGNLKNAQFSAKYKIVQTINVQRQKTSPFNFLSARWISLIVNQVTTIKGTMK